MEVCPLQAGQNRIIIDIAIDDVAKTGSIESLRLAPASPLDAPPVQPPGIDLTLDSIRPARVRHPGLTQFIGPV
jgi:hypothetical protein